MATIRLNNLTGRRLQRMAQQGSGFLLDSPLIIAKDDVAEWQTTGTGAVTYGIAQDNESLSPKEVFTLTWDASKPGTMQYGTRDVQPRFTIRKAERRNDCTYTIGYHGKRPVPPDRGAALPITIFTAIVVITALIYPVTQVINSYARNGINSALNDPTVTTPASANSITLEADQSGVVVTTSVTLTATARLAVGISGNVIDIMDVTDQKLVQQCLSGAVCTMQVRSDTPTSIQYRAAIEREYLIGQPAAVSNDLVVTWSEQPPPFKTITLAADHTDVINGTPVSLKATTDHALDGSGYVIEIATGNTIISTCSKGTICTTTVTNADVRVTYQAFIDKGKLSNKILSSNTLTVSWSAQPPIIVNTINLAISTSRQRVGQNATLTATTDQDVDSTGYVIQIKNYPGGPVLKTCFFGHSCSVNYTSSGVGTTKFQAFLVTNADGTIYRTSNIVSVSWYQVPTTITLVATSDGGSSGNYTVTATTNLPVDGTGYVIDIVLISNHGNPLNILQQRCSTGSICSTNASVFGGSTTNAYIFTAYVETSDRSSVLLTSGSAHVP